MPQLCWIEVISPSGGQPPGIWGGTPPQVGYPLPGLPPYVGSGPIYNLPVDPSYGQGHPMPPHVWVGGLPPHIWGGGSPPHVGGGPIYGGGVPPHIWGGGLPPHVWGGWSPGPGFPSHLPPLPPGVPVHLPSGGGTPTQPIFLPGTPEHPIAEPPGTLFPPPIDPGGSLEAKSWVLVYIPGLGPYWMVIEPPSPPAAQPKK
jgi:hypothetical protein